MNLTTMNNELASARRWMLFHCISALLFIWNIFPIGLLACVMAFVTNQKIKRLEAQIASLPADSPQTDIAAEPAPLGPVGMVFDSYGRLIDRMTPPPEVYIRRWKVVGIGFALGCALMFLAVVIDSAVS